MARYAREEKGNSGRTDFLAQLRVKQDKDGKMTDWDVRNHLSNNM
jgi:hypothetical protein